jgi:2-amino-4-hydroxy-6-hydroxymethyldihydropteridine diphosphokinase
MEKVYLGLGTNLGDREANLKTAVKKIAAEAGNVFILSSMYETEPWGFSSKDKFLNMVAGVETDLRPSGLLGRVLMIEAVMGRLRDGKEYSSRIIDIDILMYGEAKMKTKSLVIPHPLFHQRKFVLVPFCEIAPAIVHPVLKKDIRNLLLECSDKGEVRRYKKAVF